MAPPSYMYTSCRASLGPLGPPVWPAQRNCRFHCPAITSDPVLEDHCRGCMDLCKDHFGQKLSAEHGPLYPRFRKRLCPETFSVYCPVVLKWGDIWIVSINSGTPSHLLQKMSRTGLLRNKWKVDNCYLRKTLAADRWFRTKIGHSDEF